MALCFLSSCEVIEENPPSSLHPQKSDSSEEIITTTTAAIEAAIKPDARLLCILQKADYRMLEEADFDVAIVDPDDSALSESEIKKLQEQNKILIAYLSIGEAENYRKYWKEDWETGNPDFIEDENPEWEGNYKVRYWDEDWQKIIFENFQTIIIKGYDGSYFDIVDAYIYFENMGHENAEKEMVDFIVSLSKFAKDLNPDFLIIPQNAEELIKYRAYLEAIDGAGRENLWFKDNIFQNDEELEESLKNLDIIINSGKFVFVINYCSREENIKIFKALSEQHGFIPFAGSRELDDIKNKIFN